MVSDDARCRLQHVQPSHGQEMRAPHLASAAVRRFTGGFWRTCKRSLSVLPSGLSCLRTATTGCSAAVFFHARSLNSL